MSSIYKPSNTIAELVSKVCKRVPSVELRPKTNNLPKITTTLDYCYKYKAVYKKVYPLV